MSPEEISFTTNRELIPLSYLRKWRIRSGDKAREVVIGVTAQPVAQRHQMVSDSLALLLFIGLDLPLRSRAAAPIEDVL